MESTPRNLSAGIVAALAIAVCIYLGDLSRTRIALGLFWSLTITLFLVRGIMISRSYVTSCRNSDDAIASANRLIANGVCCAVLWGLTSWLFLPTLSPEAGTFILVGQVMVLAGGAGSQAGYRPFVRAFSWTITIVFCAGLFWHATAYNILFGVTLILLCMVTNWFAASQADGLKRQIRLRLEVEQLREEADAARDAADHANRAKTLFLASAINPATK